MNPTGRARWTLLTLALLASVGAALYASHDSPEPLASARAAPARAPVASVVVEEAGPAWRAALANAPPPMDVFTPPKEDAAAAEAPVAAAPRAPSLSVIGAMREGGEILVFLSDGRNGHAVGKGDTVNDRYRVQSIAPPAITLLDLRTRRSFKLQIGELP